MTGRPQLGDGNVIDVEFQNEQDSEVAQLTRENTQLRRALDDAKLEARRAKEDADRALGALRRNLTPLYRALQGVFGELDAAGIVDGPAPAETIPTSGRPATSARLEAWKARLPPACGKIIDALVLHDRMTASQLKVACKMGTSTVSEALAKLASVGVIDRSSDGVTIKASAK